MIIALDVDGIIADLHGEWYRRYNRDYGDDLTLDRVRSWNLHEYVKPECGQAIYDYLRDPELYESVAPIEGAAEGVAALTEDGHIVRFVTSCVFGMTDQKARWLHRHDFIGSALGRALPRELIVAEDKSMIDADLLVDDRAETIRHWVETKRRKALLYEYPHNQHLLDEVPSAFWSWCGRVSSWKQITDIIANGVVL